MSNEELLAEMKKLKQSKIFHAASIGFLAWILIFGIVVWSLNPERKIGFFIPMLIPIIIIYKLLKNPKSSTELEEVLKARKLVWKFTAWMDWVSFRTSFR
jgi:hypothetical protein